MIASIIRHILYVQYILLNFHSFTVSVKTYQVHRINESSYLVTSLPDSEFELFNSKVYDPKGSVDKMIFLNPGKDTLNPFDVGSLGESKVEKPNTKVSASYINKARENYFKHHFSESKKPVATNMELPHQSNQDAIYLNYEIKSNLESNLLKARNLASVLINESIDQDLEGKTKDKPIIKKKDVMQRTRRRSLKKSFRNPHI